MYKGKPVIAVMPLVDEEKESYWMLPGYMQGLQAVGALPLMPSLEEDPEKLDYYLDSCDGFLLTGGHDVEPALYHEQKKVVCGAVSLQRDRMDSYILKKAVELDKPVLGICRGIQLMNAAFGGTLYQDLETEYPSEIEHHMSAPYDREAHKVQIQPETPLAELLKKENCGVNSYHHQGIKELAPALEAMAFAEDGLTEAVFMPDKHFIWGVQWHPEFSYQVSEDSKKILRAFVESCK